MDYDYGARIYDGRIGKFLSTDPLTAKYPELTPYQFASDRPIDGVDEDGLEYAAPPLPGMNLNTGGAGLTKQIMDQHAQEHGVRATKYILGATAIGAVQVVDIFITKGRLTKLAMGTLLADGFEHNKAKTPEGRAEQEKRENGALTLAATMWGQGKVLDFLIPSKLVPLKEPVPIFRGTTEDWVGNPSTEEGRTPTSSNPAKATLFAIESQTTSGEQGVVYLSNSKYFYNPGASNNSLAKLESEIVVTIKPIEFKYFADGSISASEARGILKEMGINLPSRVTKESLRLDLLDTPDMTDAQVQTFIKKAQEVIKKRAK